MSGSPGRPALKDQLAEGSWGAGGAGPAWTDGDPGQKGGRGMDRKSAQLSTRSGGGRRVHDHGLSASLQEQRGTLQGFKQGADRKLCFKKIILAVVWGDGKCEEPR